MGSYLCEVIFMYAVDSYHIGREVIYAVDTYESGGEVIYVVDFYQCGKGR